MKDRVKVREGTNEEIAKLIVAEVKCGASTACNKYWQVGKWVQVRKGLEVISCS